MAKMSLKEKLAAAKAGGPAPAEPAPAAPESEPEPEQAAEPALEAAAPPPAASAPRPPQPTGQKLSLKEKLAAAKAGGPAVPSAAEPEPEPEAAPEPAAPAPAPVAAVPSEPGKKLSLKEKLAAAKGGATTSAAAPAAAKPATGAVKPAAAAAAARTLPPLDKATDPRDLAEHLRRAGAEKEKTVKAAAAKSEAAKPAPQGKRVTEAKVVPPRPGREAALSESTGASRREFLSASGVVAVIIAGWAAFTAAMSAMSLGTLRFMFPNVLAEPPSTIKVGLPTNFEPGTVNETWKAEWGFWLVRSPVYSGADAVYALSSTCTHLGCPPNWLVGEQKFKCPCHGSGFYISGVNFEGPAPRPLERFKVSVGDDGQIVVDKSLKFQEELGQWTDPDSFIPMA